MGQRKLRTPSVEDECGGALEDLRAMAGASAGRLIRASATGCCAHDQSPAQGSAAIALGVTVDGCARPVAGRAHLLVACPPGAGGGGAPVVSCVHCPLNAGGTLALQLSFSDAAPLTADQRDKLTKLSIPVLMWAKHALEIQALEARLAALEERSRTDLALAIEAQEAEREWLAYEVHDRLAQTLASVFQQLQTVESVTQSLPEIHQVAVRGSVLMREAIRETRNIMNDLQPPALAELGLIPLIEEQLRHLEEQTQCRVKAALRCGVRPPRDIEVAVYRILHEALTNIQRHAHAGEVAVSLHCGHDAVRLEVEDDGVGFDAAEALARKRVGGVLSMQRRAQLAGGSYGIESQRGKGTKLRVWIPREARLSRRSGGANGE